MLRSAPFFSRFLALFFYLLYQHLAWSYDLVAWIVSLGRWKSWVFSTLPYLPGPRVLELGHGPGHLQLAMRNKGLGAFGLDLSRQMGHLAMHKLKAARLPGNLIRGKAEHLPYSSAVFDQIVATFPSEYIFSVHTIKEIHRTLTSGGHFVILPVAWITGQGMFERLMAALFRVTGQAPEWSARFSDPLRRAGFQVKEEPLTLAGSKIMILVAQKH